MKKGEQTKQRILEVASQLFQRQGFHGTGLKQVLEESGVPKGSMYFHFPEGKEQLAAEAIQMSGQKVQRELMEAMADAPTLEVSLARMVGYFEGIFAASDCGDGCPVALLAMEMAPYSERLQQACAEIFQEWTRLITAMLEQVGVVAAQREQLATFVLSTIEGALLLSRTYGSLKPLQDAAACLNAMTMQVTDV